MYWGECPSGVPGLALAPQSEPIAKIYGVTSNNIHVYI